MSNIQAYDHTWESFTQILDRGGLLLLSNLLILLLVGSSFQALPRQATPEEVHEHMSQCLQVVPSRLLSPQMCIDAHVTSCARQTLALPIWYMLFGLRIAVLLRHSEINNVDNISSLGIGSANEEIIGFDIAINQVLFVNGLDA